jgi:ADP-heptose:LPS heptosyltransferase
VPKTADVEFAEKMLPRLEGNPRRLLIHPGSRSEFRVWPVERFAEIASRAAKELGAQVALVGGPGETKLIHDILTRATAPLMVPDKPLSTSRFAAFASRFDAMLCHDSGPMHVAAAVGTPVIALFGSQDVSIWRPSGNQHVVLRPPLPCVNCVSPTVCIPGDSYRNFCVRNLTADVVWTAVKAQLGRQV